MADVHLSTRICRVCNEEKPFDGFYQRLNRHGNPWVDTTCKACRSQRNGETVRRPDRIDAAREYRKQYKRKERREQGCTPRSEMAEAASVRLAMNALAAMAKRDAVEAWRHWITERAPSIWLDAYYAATGKPWNDHRLSVAEKFALRYNLDAEFNLKQRLRAAMRRKRQGIRLGELLRSAVTRNSASPRAEAFVGYSAKELRQHIERQFTRGMTWERFCAGEIHIDHIVPLASHDLSNPDELKAAWAMTNLRPLWAKENIRKSDNRTHLL